MSTLFQDFALDNVGYYELTPREKRQLIKAINTTVILEGSITCEYLVKNDDVSQDVIDAWHDLVEDHYKLTNPKPIPPSKPPEQLEDEILASTARVAEILLEQSTALLAKQFGDNYAKTNPNVLSNVLNLHRSVYLSMQTKG